MKIALFTDVYSPFVSGVVSVVKNQANSLKERGHEVYIFAPRYKEMNGGDAIRLPMSFSTPGPDGFRTSIPTLRSLRKLKEKEVDIIHVHTEGGVGWEGVLSAKILGLPVVTTIHTMPDDSLLGGIGMDERWGPLAWKIVLVLHNRADLTICPSKTMKRRAQENGLNSQALVLSNGIKIQGVVERGGKEKPRIIYVGRISAEKEIDVALQVFRDMKQECEFVLVGGGPLLETLEGGVEEDENIVFRGEISHDELLSSGLYRDSDIFFSASGSENQPVTFLEAMSFSLPLVGVDKNGAGELIQDNGFLAEPGDHLDLARKLDKLAENPGLRREMGQRSFEMVKNKHEIGRVAELLEGVYKNLVSGNIRQR